MFRCIDCGKTFRTPKTRYEKHGLDTPPYEEWDCCPYCGGDVETYEPLKVAIFYETIRGEGSAFIKGVPYPVTFENDDVYYFGQQNGHTVGIIRKLENQLYEINEVIPDEPQ